MKDLKLLTALDVLESEEIERQLFEVLGSSKNSSECERCMKLIFNTFEVSLLQFALRVIGNRELAQDAVQETFFRLYQRRSELNAREEARPRSWLWRCLRNLCMDHHRFASRTVAREFTDLEHDLPDQLIEFSDAEEILIDQSERSRVLSAFENIPVDQREALSLRIFSELSYEEIAKVLGRTLGSVKTLIHRGKQSLMEELK